MASTVWWTKTALISVPYSGASSFMDSSAPHWARVTIVGSGAFDTGAGGRVAVGESLGVGDGDGEAVPVVGSLLGDGVLVAGVGSSAEVPVLALAVRRLGRLV